MFYSSLAEVHLDPRKYFVFVFASFGNGESSSPSNTVRPRDPKLGPNETALHSMGPDSLTVLTKVTFMYLHLVEKIVVICSAAQTSAHNRRYGYFTFYDRVINDRVYDSITEGHKHALLASKDFEMVNIDHRRSMAYVLLGDHYSVGPMIAR
ncbi:hypothetical protein BDN67DRAFT_1013727 [Paxillus ammoniavirescens]|nr:hypothetical protein BDN67DRAFT_1013727 [Paxillus ammoniavirescens]